MTNNTLLRGLRYLLNVHDQTLVEILALAGQEVPLAEVAAFMTREEEPGYRPCPDEVLAGFLNGLVTWKRGPSSEALTLELPVTNNLVLKKLRVAFALKDTDLIRLIEKSGTLRVTRSELGAFFRKSDHRNYRECGDQFLRHVLRSMSS